MIENYPKAYSEVLTVLNYMPEQKDMLPQDLLDMFNEKRDKTHEFNVELDEDGEILNYESLLPESRAILINLYATYWATPEEKQEKFEQEEKEKWANLRNPDLFNKPKEEVYENINTKLPVEYKESLWKKFIDFFKKIFNRGNM